MLLCCKHVNKTKTKNFADLKKKIVNFQNYKLQIQKIEQAY